MVICPLCEKPLFRDTKSWHCEDGHSFDVARQGYVNLLTVQQKHSLNPGDTRDMVLARREFLEAGYYAPIGETLKRLVEQHCPTARDILDVGCGEGYYLSHLTHIPNRVGIDISKEAVRCAAAKYKDSLWLTATASHLPFEANSFDCLLSMFALTMEEEYRRVLKPGGIFVQVLAGKSHLTGLKNIIYPTLVEKEKNLQPTLEGFTHIHSETLTFAFSVEENKQVRNLLSMTPHVWRISKEAAQTLEQTERLQDRAEVIFNLYQAK